MRCIENWGNQQAVLGYICLILGFFMRYIKDWANHESCIGHYKKVIVFLGYPCVMRIDLFICPFQLTNIESISFKALTTNQECLGSAF